MKKLRVAQCWDDGVFTDIRLTQILRKYQAKATFNLCSGLTCDITAEPYWYQFTKENPVAINSFYAGRVGKDRIREVYDGFEVASHCDKHEDARRNTPEAFLEAAMKSRCFLEETFQKECRGFAWPNGAYTDETVKVLKDAGFAYGRTVENTDDVTANPEPMLLKSSCHFMNRNFWDLYNNAKNGSGVFYFWGHSYEMRDIEPFWRNYEAMIAYISEDPDAEWVNVIDLV